MCDGLEATDWKVNFAKLCTPISLSECQYHLDVILSTSHSSFLTDIISSISERQVTLVFLYLGGREETTKRPTIAV